MKEEWGGVLFNGLLESGKANILLTLSSFQTFSFGSAEIATLFGYGSFHRITGRGGRVDLSIVPWPRFVAMGHLNRVVCYRPPMKFWNADIGRVEMDVVKPPLLHLPASVLTEGKSHTN